MAILELVMGQEKGGKRGDAGPKLRRMCYTRVIEEKVEGVGMFRWSIVLL